MATILDGRTTTRGHRAEGGARPPSGLGSAILRLPGRGCLYSNSPDIGCLRWRGVSTAADGWVTVRDHERPVRGAPNTIAMRKYDS